MDQTLMGAETEFGFTPFANKGFTLDLGEWLDRLIATVRDSRPHLCGRGKTDVYLGSGARIYMDCGHPEWATPEVSSPRECVRYMRAGEATLLAAAAELERTRPELSGALLFKSNVDYSSIATWGAHENYLYRAGLSSPLFDLMIPHLITRIVFTGPGGLKPDSPGIEFSLSPRAWRLKSDISHQHSVFNTRDEPLAEGYHRLHVVAGESLCSQRAELLRFGTTALVLALYDSGVEPWPGAQLVEPLEAMRDFAADSSCTMRCRTALGESISAAEVQRQYLERVEARLDERYMPSWAEEICAAWRAVLDALQDDPASLAAKLDWPLKLAIFRQRAERHGIPWTSVDHWTRAQALSHVSADRKPMPRRADGLERRLRSIGCPDETVGALLEQLQARRLSPEDLWRSYLALKSELQEIDVRFSRLGPGGIHAELDLRGLLDHRVVSDDEIAEAMDRPPATGRAKLRGDQIRHLAGRRRDARCDWTRILDQTGGRILDLSDPFRETAPRWVKRDPQHGLEDPEELSMLPDFLRRRSRFVRRRLADEPQRASSTRRRPGGPSEPLQGELDA